MMEGQDDTRRDLEGFFETHGFGPGNRTVSVFDLQGGLYKKRNIFMSGSAAGFPLGFGGCFSGWFPRDMT